MSAARPLRVAFVQHTLAAGGAERVAVEQIRALASIPSVVDVWLTDDDRRDLEPAARAAHPGVDRVGLARSVGALALRLLRGRYDLVVTTGTRRGLRAVGLQRRMPFARRPAVLMTLHIQYPDHVDRLAPWTDEIDAYALLYDFRDIVAESLGVARARMVVTPPVFDSYLPDVDAATSSTAADLRASWGASERSVVLGSFGRIAPNKGIVPVIRMADRLAAAGRDVHLVVGGGRSPGAPPASPYDREIDAAVGAAKALEGRFHRVGAAAGSLAMYGAFDLFVLLARHEGVTLVLREAMTVGTPVLASAVGGIARTLTDGLDAALVEKDADDGSDWTEGDLERFEARLAALVDDAHERRRLGASGRERTLAWRKGHDFAAAFRSAVDTALASRREAPAIARADAAR